MSALISADPAKPGDIKAVAHGSLPVGWLACDGAAVSRSLYAALFLAIGTAWGAGDGSTTFNLPDLRGRSPVGSGTGGGLSARSVGQSGGAEVHALSAAEMPSHDHRQTHGANAAAYSSGGSSSNPVIAGDTSSKSDNGALNTQGAGSGGSHNNMQPFAVCNFVIKT